MLKIDDDQLLKDYKNLYWTRLMQVEDYEAGMDRKLPMGPDIVEACQSVADMDSDEDAEWSPLFEPTDFNKEHGPLEVEEYRLPADDLKAWAERCVALRSSIAERAKE